MTESLNNELLGKAILSLGDAEFAHALLEAMEPCVPVDHLAIVVFDDELTAHLAGAGSRQPGNAALEAGQLYERARFYQHDPGAKQLGGARDSGGGGPVLARLRASEITNPKYRREIYDRFRLLERLSIVDRVRTRWVMLNLYRDRGSEPFRDRDITRLRDLAVLLVGLAGKHADLAIPTTGRRDRYESVQYFDTLLAAIEGRLTPRERAVCAHALTGQTVHGIASELKIRPPTVATLRRRAYAKLNISSLNELFARCMAQLARDSPVRK